MPINAHGSSTPCSLWSSNEATWHQDRGRCRPRGRLTCDLLRVFRRTRRTASWPPTIRAQPLRVTVSPRRSPERAGGRGPRRHHGSARARRKGAPSLCVSDPRGHDRRLGRPRQAGAPARHAGRAHHARQAGETRGRAPDLPPRLLVGAAVRAAGTCLRRDEHDLDQLTKALVRWCDLYATPIRAHRWSDIEVEPLPLTQSDEPNYAASLIKANRRAGASACRRG